MQTYFWIIFLSVIAFADISSSKLPLLQSGNSKYWCPVTGENLQEHYQTNYFAKLKNGTVRQYSSFFGLYSDINEYGILKNSAKKYDDISQKFVSINLQNMKYTESEFLKQKKWIHNIKVKKLYLMGEKIFTQRCKKRYIDLENYLELNELKGSLVESKYCGNLPEEYLHALGIYLWDVKKLGITQNQNTITVHEDDKCPVCGMFSHKYPKWVAKLHYGNTYFAFDGVKDLIKFYFNPLKWGKYKGTEKNRVTKFEVTDYYTQNAIDGFKAFYVIRSDVYGPMGNELIPFEKLEDAKNFMIDHRGKIVLRFNEISQSLPYQLDSK
jgi:nitrous oxide reductase accessory protein NosL